MPLYSTDTLSNAIESNYNSELHKDGSSKVKTLSEYNAMDVEKDENESWCYLFVHHAKAEYISKEIEKKFVVFVHKTVIYSKSNHKIITTLQPTISGLIFVQGNSVNIQSFLNSRFSSLHLVKDYSNNRIAVIKDSVMQSFMRIARIEPSRIRFLSKSFEYYSIGHPLVRITSGLLEGMEGYIIRISRDKRLVTSLGNMTVAIGKVCKESFENVEDYVRIMREQQKENKSECNIELSPLQKEIEKSFFKPNNQIDLMVLAKNIDVWIIKSKEDIRVSKISEAEEIILFMMEKLGDCLKLLSCKSESLDFSDLLAICEFADDLLMSIVQNESVDVEMRESVEADRNSLILRYPYLFPNTQV